jgi:nitrogen fixation NifU-like protein
MFEDVRDLYNATIVERGRRPLHMRRLEAFDVTAKGDNPMCGDRVQVWVRYGADGTIAEAGFEAKGCEISKAAADLMVEAVQGRSPDDTRALFARLREMAQSGVCPEHDPALAAMRPLAAVHEYKSRVKCVTLPWQALIGAIEGKGETSSE